MHIYTSCVQQSTIIVIIILSILSRACIPSFYLTELNIGVMQTAAAAVLRHHCFLGGVSKDFMCHSTTFYCIQYIGRLYKYYYTFEYIVVINMYHIVMSKAQNNNKIHENMCGVLTLIKYHIIITDMSKKYYRLRQNSFVYSTIS